MMRASEFEFRNRWWLIGCLYGCPFVLFNVDHLPLGVRLARGISANFHWHMQTALHVVFGISAVLMLLAAMSRTWGSAYLGREVVHDSKVHSETLQADGPYRHVRNPLYLGNILMALAMGLMAPLSASVLILLGITLFVYRLIGREEAALESTQGVGFREYMKAVPRLFPALLPRIPATGNRPDWLNGFVTEVFFYSFAFGIIAFSLTFNTKWFYAGLVLSPILSWVASTIYNRVRPKSNAAAGN